MLKTIAKCKIKIQNFAPSEKNPPVIFYMLEHLKVASINDNMIQK